MMTDLDVFVVGGGVNGCGIARDAVGRGFSVALAEMNDLASGTSSASSKLIHGGLRYLEHYEFGLVREALGEREILLRTAPHIIWPMRFVLPHHRDLRPAWILRTGLFLYDHLGRRELLPGTSDLDLRRSELGLPLDRRFVHGFEYSDCGVNDARLVVLNARDAADRGAQINVRTKVTAARREGERWHIETRNRASGETRGYTAKFLVNAAGPWVDSVLGNALAKPDTRNVRLVQGSHIVVPRLYQHDRAYVFQNADGRVIFVIPYEDDFTLIGTTDIDYRSDPSSAVITESEKAYLAAAASQYLARPVLVDDIVWSYSGVRPLYDDGASAAQEATRDYVLRLDNGTGPPLLNIFGGKLTTYRRLAESALALIERALGTRRPAWTARSHLPGGDFDPRDVEQKVGDLRREYPFLAYRQATRLLRSYGTKAWTLLGDARHPQDLGKSFGDLLTEREVDYLVRNEWANTADDVLWRRSKLGLRLAPADQDQLSSWLEQRSNCEAAGE